VAADEMGEGQRKLWAALPTREVEAARLIACAEGPSVCWP